MLKAPGLNSSRLEALIVSLDSTLDGDLAAKELVARGEQSIPFLAAFLRTPPRALPHARKRAIRALADLGAKAELQEYLNHRPSSADHIVQLAEDEVESLAAHELSRWRTPEVERTLLRIAGKHLTLGSIYALGELQSIPAIPILVHALGDDTCHLEAEEALAKMPVPIQDSLIRALMAKTRTPTDTRRQIRAARMLVSYRLNQSEWIQLIPLLSSTDNNLAISIARIGLRNTTPRDWPVLIHNILHSLRGLSWLVEAEVAEDLREREDIAMPMVYQRIRELQERGHRTDLADPEWRILLGFVSALQATPGPTGPRRA